MTELDTRVAVLLLWGGGTVLVYAIVLGQRIASWRVHRDRRARRDVMSGFALFLTALGSGAAVAFVLFGDAGQGARGVATAVALGAFTGAGLVLVSEDATDETG